jgi:thiosulfate/3-mercaptopyruvate sulfurtransferase
LDTSTATKDRSDTSDFSGYAHPEMLVSTQWVEDHLKDDNLRIVESDEDVLLYEQGHVPGAVKLDWHTDLQDDVRRDYIESEQFARLCSERGIANDTTVILYGDKNNWWATYALWVFQLFGHDNVKIWTAAGRSGSPRAAPSPETCPSTNGPSTTRRSVTTAKFAPSATR